MPTVAGGRISIVTRVRYASLVAPGQLFGTPERFASAISERHLELAEEATLCFLVVVKHLFVPAFSRHVEADALGDGARGGRRFRAALLAARAAADTTTAVGRVGAADAAATATVAAARDGRVGRVHTQLHARVRVLAGGFHDARLRARTAARGQAGCAEPHDHIVVVGH